VCLPLKATIDAVGSPQWSRHNGVARCTVAIFEGSDTRCTFRIQRLNVVQIRGKFSTSSPATAPEMLATEVTPGLLAGAEPDAHQFYVTIVCNGYKKE
jgi:hypothetical protein